MKFTVFDDGDKTHAETVEANTPGYGCLDIRAGPSPRPARGDSKDNDTRDA